MFQGTLRDMDKFQPVQSVVEDIRNSIKGMFANDPQNDGLTKG